MPLCWTNAMKNADDGPVRSGPRERTGYDPQADFVHRIKMYSIISTWLCHTSIIITTDQGPFLFSNCWSNEVILAKQRWSSCWEVAFFYLHFENKVAIINFFICNVRGVTWTEELVESYIDYKRRVRGNIWAHPCALLFSKFLRSLCGQWWRCSRGEMSAPPVRGPGVLLTNGN